MSNYSAYGHVERMAEAVAEGARAVPGTEVTIKRVPELLPEEIAKKSGMKLNQFAPIANYDAIIFGRTAPGERSCVCFDYAPRVSFSLTGHAR